MSISNAFMTFGKEAPEQQKAWGELIGKLDNACKLDKKTEALAYLAVLASARLESGI
ncbi:carboxymuconolactone decarboxylase family protein, partial [Clostridium sp. PL3]|nr:carboxymuconolactone decarboxylase family protein [Clostridium thailandense]